MTLAVSVGQAWMSGDERVGAISDGAPSIDSRACWARVPYFRCCRDVLLTLATHGFFSPKWSPRIRAGWCRNVLVRSWPSGDFRGAVAKLDGEAVAISGGRDVPYHCLV